MQRSLPRQAVAAKAGAVATVVSAAAALALAVLAAPASGAIAYKACKDTNDFACARLQVPLDPGGTTPGTVTLAVRRHLAPLGGARSAIVALAGGPGQSAIPFASDFAEGLGAIATTRDLIVFDQRGTGESGALKCKALKHVYASTPPPAAMRACAAQLGPSRAFYGTAASVADIEAVRREGGYEKLVLYGTSYGTKVAEDYAQAYPEHVEALVLDSVVPPGAPEALDRATFRAVPRVVREVCRRNVCRGLTRNPARDLAEVLSRIHGGGLHGRVVGEDGRARSFSITAQRILDAMLGGDFSPPLRAALVSATRSAALGDYAPLARVLAILPGEEEGGESGGFDVPLYYATSCEDQAFPWSPGAKPAARLLQARAAARALGAKAFAPFDASDALALSDVSACAYWPSASPFPAVSDGPLPGVPTLILSGAYDMRTPTANAREVAAKIPGSHLLIVPRVGHSVLGEPGAACAGKALQALFARRPIVPCREGPVAARLRPPPLAPLRVSAIAPLRGYSGLPGRTARGIQMTLEDVSRVFALTLEAQGEALLFQPTLHFGGLRGGWARLTGGGVSFHGYSFVPGLKLSGTLHLESAHLRVYGADAAAGLLRLGSHHLLVGTLGGRHVRLAVSGERATAIVGADAAARDAHDLHRAGERARLLGLARSVERLLGP
ncbi:MAG TPA: alpha/beta fold hydrolase [Solirubrobacteraceae bacterium]|nr:alpha/beta fold hydrolase [Solirubrobacteraceae bacterium]